MPSGQYAAHAFHDGFKNGKSSGLLTIGAQTITFEGGGRRIVLTLADIEIKAGGASNRLIYFSSPGHPDWSIYTADKTVLKDPVLLDHPRLLPQSRKARSAHSLNRNLLLGVCLLLLAGVVGLYFSMSSLNRLAAEQVPPEWEVSMGESVLDQYRINSQLMPDKQAQALLQPLTAPLLAALPASPYPYQLFIVNDPAINAFALPGGYIVIHSGLILAAGNASELLGVLAHEASHVTQRHGTRNLINTLSTLMLVNLVFGDVSGLGAVLVNAAPVLINQSYSREFEREADREGFALLQRANIDPAGLLSFFSRLREEEKQRLAAMTDADSRDLAETAFGLLSSHPATAERIDNLQALINQTPHNGHYRADEQAFQTLKQAVSGFVADSGQETFQDERRD
jgi:beta-barrel assembly-enhancing protease